MSLLENAYDFLNESLRNASRSGNDATAWKFAVLNVVQGLELLLKARLHAAHPVLVFQNVDQRTKTVGLDQAVTRLAGAAQIELTSDELRSIRTAKKWRDAITHYEFEMSAYEVESVFVELFELLTRFHNEHTVFGLLHEQIDPDLWDVEAELFAFFKSEFVTYNGKLVMKSWPAKIVEAQNETVIELHGEEYELLPYGTEPLWEMSADRSPCGDCAVTKGQLHVSGCDVEACPRCFGQLLSCGCQWGEGPAESEIEPLEVQVQRWRRKYSEAANQEG